MPNNNEVKKIKKLLAEEASKNIGSATQKQAMAQLLAIQKAETEEKKVEGDLQTKQQELALKEKQAEEQTKAAEIDRALQEKNNKKAHRIQMMSTIISAFATLGAALAGSAFTIAEKKKDRAFYAWQASESRKYETTGNYTAFSSKQVMNDVFKRH